MFFGGRGVLRVGGESDIRVLEEGDEMQTEPEVPEARGRCEDVGRSQNFVCCIFAYLVTLFPHHLDLFHHS